MTIIIKSDKSYTYLYNRDLQDLLKLKFALKASCMTNIIIFAFHLFLIEKHIK